MNRIKINQLKTDLLNRYDYINKLDGIKFLTQLYGGLVSVKECKQAWEEAYNG